MKYLIIIFSIISAASVISFFFFFSTQQPPASETVVSINGYPLTRQVIQKYKDKDIHHGDNADFISEMITKQLLIAEAQRLGIDKEPSFRAALKTFYEHSLIKIVLDRVEKDTQVSITEEEVDRYINSFGKIYTFYTYNTSETVKGEIIKTEGKLYSSRFDDLGDHVQYVLASLRPGDSAISYITGNEKLAVYLEKIEGESNPSHNLSRKKIKEQLRRIKVEAAVNSWIQDLRDNASITYNTTQE